MGVVAALDGIVVGIGAELVLAANATPSSWLLALGLVVLGAALAGIGRVLIRISAGLARMASASGPVAVPADDRIPDPLRIGLRGAGARGARSPGGGALRTVLPV